ncbi:MAG: S26 family signal peptidase [Verrucomicrobiales bacterium]
MSFPDPWKSSISLSPKSPIPPPSKKGQLIARGYVETGDQVIVDKFSYHWRRPQHDEVFVFNTRGIAGINVSSNEGSQHYIKRLAGVPGDRVEIKDQQLALAQWRRQPGKATKK